jgi:hypothetical protein
MGWARELQRVGAAIIVALCAGACTDPVQRNVPIEITVDADSLVRKSTARVELEAEAQLAAGTANRGETWESVLQLTLKPNPKGMEDWPWQVRLEPEQSAFKRYRLVAIARDKQNAVVGQGEAVRDLAEARRSGLRVHFDTACYRPATRCDEGFTCSGGACIDASGALAAADGGMPAVGMDEQGVSGVEVPEGVAAVGASCTDGVRACSEHGSRIPLVCEDGTFRAEAECAETERCDSAMGPERGTCKPIATECANRQVNVAYCEGEKMRVCTDLVRSEERACSENEWCASNGASAECSCRAGFAKESDSGPCKEATDCGDDNGGCDTTTDCTMVNGKPTCGPCPAGYTGLGAVGCVPLLQALGWADGALEPAFSPGANAYRARVPLLTQRIALTAAPPAGGTIKVNGVALDASGAWTSPVLSLGETPIEIELTSPFGVSNTYTVMVERTVEQEAYIKSMHHDERDHFGFWVDYSNDTLLVTAWLDDSAATGIDGDETNNAASDSGAAFVYVRDGKTWKQQAYLKASDTRAGDYFGGRADLEGDTIVIGAVREGLYNPGIALSTPGAAYVYTRKSGVWSQTQRLAAAQPNGADLFGAGVSIGENWLAIGAPFESTDGDKSGSVHMFERSGDMWIERQKLKSSKPLAAAGFGASVSLDGEWLVAGTPDDARPERRSGSAEVWALRGGKWVFHQYLQAAMPSGESTFGFTVSMSGERIVIGAPRTALYLATEQTGPGEAYVFELQGDRWMQTAVLKGPESRRDDGFGMDVVVSGTTIAVGAAGNPVAPRGFTEMRSTTDARPVGAAYLFGLGPDGWKASAMIQPRELDADDGFGYALAFERDTLVVGAYLESSTARGINGMGASSGSLNSGAVWVFR